MIKKIEFYKERTFSEKIDDTFTFVKENWKVLLKYNVIVILPLTLILTFFFNKVALSPEGFQQHTTLIGNEAILDMFQRIAPLSGISFIVTWIFYALQTTLIKAYIDHENNFEGILWKDIQQSFFHNIGRFFILGIVTTLIFILAVVVVTLLAIISLYTLIITIPLFIIGIIPMVMIMPYYMYQPDGIMTAVRNGYRLGWNTYGGLIAMGITLTVITSLLTIIPTIPWSICVAIHTLDSDGTGLAVALFLTAVFYIFGSALVYIILIVGQSIQYGHAYVKWDGDNSEEEVLDEDLHDSDSENQEDDIRLKEDPNGFMPKE
jgi:hypothetical protein